jgi:biotin synthase-related radical SAM superfamily protein
LNSPEYIQTSLAAAMSLGFEAGSFKDPVRLTGLNLLLTYDEGCLGKCAYCGIAGGRNGTAKSRGTRGMLNNKIIEPAGDSIDAGIIADDNLNGKRSNAKKTFIRVKWPVYRLDDVLYALKEHESSFERVCLSMITHADAIKDTIAITKKIKQFSNLPLSLLITPSLIGSPEILRQFKAAGAEMAGIAIDAATKDLFKKYRGAGVGGPHKWQKYWEVLKWSADVFGRFKAGIHLIVGLGETEEQAVKIIYDAHLLGAKTHLFSFYPEPASLLEGLSRPELVSYRKIQIARYLINEKGLDISKIRFDRNGIGNSPDSNCNSSSNGSINKNSDNIDSNSSVNGSGRIISFDYGLAEVLKEGYAFMTSGCPCSSDSRISACNRPFANERPSETFRNYPYTPNEEDKKTIASQISELLLTVSDK